MDDTALNEARAEAHPSAGARADDETGAITLAAPAPPGLEAVFAAWGEATSLAISVAENRIMQALHEEIAALRAQIGAKPAPKRPAQRTPKPAPEPRRARAPRPAPEPKAASGIRSWRTPERRAVLLEHYPKGARRELIETLMRALPGPELGDVYMWASDLGIRRETVPPPPGAAIQPVLPASRAEMKTRDGQISVAAILEKNADRAAASAPYMTLKEALAWAREAKMKIPDPQDRKAVFAAVNALRRQWGLPTWRPAPWREGK